VASVGVTTLLNPSSSAVSRYGSVLLEGPILFLLARSVAKDAHGASTLSSVLAFSTVAVAAASTSLALVGLRYDSIVRGLTGSSSASPPLRLGIERQQASFDAPLFYAVWLVVAAGLVLPGIERRRRRIAWLSAFVVMCVAVLTTLSRIAIVLLPLVVAAYAAQRRRWVSATAAFCAAGALMLAVALGPLLLTRHAAAPPAVPRASQSASAGTSRPPQSATPAAPATRAPVASTGPAIADDIASSNAARLDAVVAAIRATGHRPLFGWGPLAAKDVVADELGHPNFVDNTYLALLVEDGIVGFGAFVVLIGTVIVAASRSAGTAGGAARLTAIGTLLVCCLFAAFLSVSQGYALASLVYGLAVGAAESAERDRERDVLPERDSTSGPHTGKQAPESVP
jgi:hypothetical protein